METEISFLNTKIDTMEGEFSEINTSLNLIIKKLEESESKEKNEKEISENEEKSVSYIVQSGDSLIKICKLKGIDYYANINEILEINNISDPNQIYVGQFIKLPKQ